MRTSWIFVVALAATSTGCLRSTEYRCSTSSECGTGGSCESIGFCSFPDGTCSSGERFTDSAGSLANQCTGSTGQDGGPIDTPSGIDAAIDSSAAGCPGNYVTITGGQGTHRYRLMTSGNWGQLNDMCKATTSSAYLAIPDDPAELQALATVAAQSPFWVGVTDDPTEGVWVTTKGTAQTYLPWQTGAPNLVSNNQDDCVEVNMATLQFKDERCNNGRVGLCECEP